MDDGWKTIINTHQPKPYHPGPLLLPSVLGDKSNTQHTTIQTHGTTTHQARN